MYLFADVYYTINCIRSCYRLTQDHNVNQEERRKKHHVIKGKGKFTSDKVSMEIKSYETFSSVFSNNSLYLDTWTGTSATTQLKCLCQYLPSLNTFYYVMQTFWPWNLRQLLKWKAPTHSISSLTSGGLGNYQGEKVNFQERIKNIVSCHKSNCNIMLQKGTKFQALIIS